ncbi:phosphotransferase family protein [Streptacidiphilus sp. MAP5-52]|uniref:phosphotransferase family protein n=1 Tax=Streptacidiphilus sp. MAP5-52 TaxID=3156267 RepID=UPI003515FD52
MGDPSGEEIALTGGRITRGLVRIGDRVNRPTTAASPFVADLLRLFERQAFRGAPRYLGQSDGMDILTFIPGDVPERFQVWSDEQVAAAGALLRSMHDATRGSALAGSSPVVCHHDTAPNNAVFVNGLPVAWIDFDGAAPGSPLEDLGYAAWTWCIASKHAARLGRQAEQVRALADAYGLEGPERGALVDAIVEQQARNARFWAEVMASGQAAPAEPHVLASRIDWSRRELHFTVEHRRTFEERLK